MAGKNIYVLDHDFVSSVFVWDKDHATVKAENDQLKTENERLKKLTHRVYEELAEFKRKHTQMMNALVSYRIKRTDSSLEELLEMYKNIVNELQRTITARQFATEHS